ncbi:MAG: hypothetical protein ABL994_09930, partial [Verrucomicrobiales bacterium]
VGVLIIVLVLVGISVASAVKKILSDLPPVTPEQLEQLEEIMSKKIPVPDLEKVQEQIVALEDKIKKGTEDITSLDRSAEGLSLADIPDLEKQIEEKKKARDTKKTEIETLLAELDKLKATLDQTPIVAPAAGTVVRLPNPKPYPEKPNETRILVAKEGVIFLNEKQFMGPIFAELDRTRSQFEYKSPDPAPFLPLLQKIFTSKEEIQTAWQGIAPLAGKYQMDVLAKSWKVLGAGGLQPSTAMLETLGNISIVVRKPMHDVAAALVAATKADYSLWVAMDTSTDPLKPNIKAIPEGNKVALHWGSKVEEVSADQRGILRYFKDLGDSDSFKDASKSKVIYDAYRLVEFLKSPGIAAAIPKTFSMDAVVKPGSTLVQIALTPKSGETVEKMKQPGSQFIRVLREIKDDPSGVALFQVVPDAIATYLGARELADQVGVPATWDFLGNLNVAINVAGFEVQRFAESAPARPAAPNLIAPPKRTLD